MTLRRLLAAFLLAVLPWTARAAQDDLVVGVNVRLPEQHEGVRLFVDELNATGGIAGHRVRLKLHEDGFSMDRALENARELALDDETLVVIGHSGSAVSIAAGKIYTQAGLAAVTPFSTNDRVTKGNPLYFRTTFTDSVQGEALAHYARSILGAKAVTIVSDDGIYGSFVADVFAATAGQSGLKVARRIQVKADAREEDVVASEISAMAATLSGTKPDTLVFVAAGAKTSAAVVKAIRDAHVYGPILLPDEGASAAFLNDVLGSPKRALYTRDLHVASPFIFDIGGPRAQAFRQSFLARTGREPTYQTAYGYDAMAVIAEALRRAHLDAGPLSLADKRARVRDALASIDKAAQAVPGITGPLWFDADGNAVGCIISVGEIRNGAVVSSVAQLRPVRRSEDDPRDAAELTGADLIHGAEGRLYQKTNVAYTGIHLRRLDAVDTEGGTFGAEFDLWFRAHQEVDGGRLVFSNAVDAVSIEETRRWSGEGGLVYQLFTVKGRFRMDSLPGTDLLREHALGVQYYHRDLDASALLFVKDWLEDERRTTADYRDHGLLAALRGWKLAGVSYFPDTFARNTLGDTLRAGAVTGTVDHSRFNAVLHVEKDAFVLADWLRAPWLAAALAGAAALTVGLGMLRRHRGTRHMLLARFVSAMALVYLARESVVAYHGLIPGLPAAVARDVLTGLAVGYWILGAYFANRWIELTLWRAIERKDGHAVPVLMRRVVMSIIFVGASFGVVSFVLDRDLTSLLATSGVVAMILGLALQPNLANIFSGIALNLEKPFQIGDWIEIRIGRDVAVGQVEDMNWRTTKIVTPDGTHIAVPNGQLANVNINNLGPSRVVTGTLKVVLASGHEPGQVTERLRAAAVGIEGVTKVKVEMVALDRDSIEYTVKISHDSAAGAVTTRAWKRIWEVLHDMDPALGEPAPA